MTLADADEIKKHAQEIVQDITDILEDNDFTPTYQYQVLTEIWKLVDNARSNAGISIHATKYTNLK